MHPNAQYWIGNYFFVILFTFYWYFIVKLLSFLFSTTFFSTSFILLLHKKKSMTNICAVFGCKANFRTQKQKKIISNPQSIIKFPSKWLESMNTLLFLTKRFDWGTTTTIYLCDAMWPSPSLSQFSAWSENIYGKHHCQILHQSINQLLNNPFVMWITRNCVTCNL